MWIEILLTEIIEEIEAVTPLAGVWIEIHMGICFICINFVTPLAGVWIEIEYCNSENSFRETSHPSRVCGLKYQHYNKNPTNRYVTPLAGVWIEILTGNAVIGSDTVTPLAGVWIEIASW